MLKYGCRSSNLQQIIKIWFYWDLGGSSRRSNLLYFFRGLAYEDMIYVNVHQGYQEFTLYWSWKTNEEVPSVGGASFRKNVQDYYIVQDLEMIVWLKRQRGFWNYGWHALILLLVRDQRCENFFKSYLVQYLCLVLHLSNQLLRAQLWIYQALPMTSRKP